MTETQAPPTGKDLFVEIMAHITAYPQDWDQNTWMARSRQSTCGTAGCIAGWACVIHGMTNEWGALLPEFAEQDWDGLARGLLEIDGKSGHPWGQPMFSGSNTMADLYNYGAYYYDIEKEVLHKEVDAVLDDILEEIIQAAAARVKAKRSAAAKKGWATRRAKAAGV
jgi:hypothetical protein